MGPGIRISMALLFFFPGQAAHQVLEGSQGADGGAVNPAQQQGDEQDQNESCSPKDGTVNEFKQGRNKLQIEQFPCNGPYPGIPEIQEQEGDQQKEDKRYGHPKRFEMVKFHGAII